MAVGLLAGFIEGVNFFVSLRDGSSNFLFISGPVPTNSEDLVAITASRLLVSRLCLLELLVVAFDVIGIICECRMLDSMKAAQREEIQTNQNHYMQVTYIHTYTYMYPDIGGNIKEINIDTYPMYP